MALPTAVIPLNRLSQAKGRLAGALAPEERRELALITAATVVSAARGAGLEVWLLGPDPAELRLVAGADRYLAENARLSGLNAQLGWAIRPLESVVILHADLPLATPDAIRRLLEAAPPSPRAMTAVESGDGGTNAMFLRPAAAFPLAYGRGSLAKHLAAAQEAGLEVAVVAIPELALDLDTPADITTLLASVTGRESEAGRYLAARSGKLR